MSWAEAMKENARVASRDRVSAAANVVRSAPSTSWDPYEVWLSRVKQPRDRAASRRLTEVCALRRGRSQ